MSDSLDITPNVTLYDDAGNPVNVILQDGIYRLAVNANATIENNESPTKYQLKSDKETTGTSINATSDTTLFSYTGDGVLDFIAVTNATTANWEIALFVDGTERFRITMSELGSTLGLTGSSNESIWTQVANKQFRYHPSSEIGFSTSIELKAKATSGTTTLNHLVLYRERVE